MAFSSKSVTGFPRSSSTLTLLVFALIATVDGNSPQSSSSPQTRRGTEKPDLVNGLLRHLPEIALHLVVLLFGEFRRVRSADPKCLAQSLLAVQEIGRAADRLDETRNR